MHKTVKSANISMFELVYIALSTCVALGRREVTGWTSTPKSTVAATAPLFGELDPYNLQYIKTTYISTQYHLYVSLDVILSVRGERALS
jgi:hypothetical protein